MHMSIIGIGLLFFLVCVGLGLYGVLHAWEGLIRARTERERMGGKVIDATACSAGREFEKNGEKADDC